MGLDKERNHHMMFLVKFNTIEDYREYSTHPVHMEIMRTILLPILEPGNFPHAVLVAVRYCLHHVILRLSDGPAV